MKDPESSPSPVYIPRSYKTGVNLLITSLPVQNFLEGVLFSAVPAAIACAVLRKTGFAFSTKIIIVIVSASLFGYFGFTGINGGTLSAFLADFIRYRRNRRVLYYNPRVKREAEPQMFRMEDRESLLSRESLRKLCDALAEAKRKGEERNAQSLKDSSVRQENLFFEEDRGIVETPWDYRTKKERRQYRKIRNRQKKQEGSGKEKTG